MSAHAAQNYPFLNERVSLSLAARIPAKTCDLELRHIGFRCGRALRWCLNKKSNSIFLQNSEE